MGKRVSHPLLPVLLIALLIVPASADIIMPGTKYVSSCVEIGNTNDYPGYLFLVYPLWMSGGYGVMGPGNCTSFYKFATPSFYAVQADAFNETAASTEGSVSAAYFSGDPAVIPSGLSLHSISSVPVSSPVTALRTLYHINSVNSTGLEIVPVSVQYTYTDGKTEEIALQPGETPSVPSGPDTVGLVLTLAAGSAIALILRTRKRSR
ncbi:MAG: hypothetical protein LUQ64_02850 [Methanomicrobiales archaeon]|nr:hypothetical protein [Methanomicrobiales archaeon]